jgi:thiol:disulfide interchange protein
MWFCAIVSWLLATFQAPATSSSDVRLEARLLAAHSSICRGGQTELAIELTLTEGWHVYHPILLGIGLPTTVDFRVPAGATVTEPRFPAPTLEYDLGQEYLGLGGRFVVLATLRLDEQFSEQEVAIGARIRALACRKVCIPVEAEAALILPVREVPGEPTNAQVFEQARAALARPLAQAEFLEGSRLLVSHMQLPVGGRGEVYAVIRVRSGYHVLDRDPGVEGLIPTRLFIERRDGISLGSEVWPAAKVIEIEGIGRVREQAGEFVVRVPFEVSDEKFRPGPVRLAVLVQYQACSEAGTCFPPAMAEETVEFTVLPAGAVATVNPDPVAAKLWAAGPPAQSSESGRASGQVSLLAVFWLAFLGGLILNVMPCVLPVISLKILGFVQQAGDDRGRILRMGLTYVAGIMASFVVLAALLAYAKQAWGGLMQQPGFLIGLIAVVFAFSLSLLGVYELQLPGRAVQAADRAAAREGYGGAFFNGVLTTLLATPCVGPFLGSAVGLLTQLPSAAGAAGVMMVGLGLSAPYLLLSVFPGWLAYLPRPGPWMITFKQVVGFVLIAVVVWLLAILSRSAGQAATLGTLGTLVAVGLGCWLLGRVTPRHTRAGSVVLWVSGLAAMVGGGWFSFAVFRGTEAVIPWQAWEPGLAERLSAEGYTVYVDYTADWCLTCQWNKKTALHTQKVVRVFRELGVYPIKADFTGYDPRMKAELQRYGRAGVPTNVILPAGRPNDPMILPEVLTSGRVVEALREAGPSQRAPDFWAANR